MLTPIDNSSHAPWKHRVRAWRISAARGASTKPTKRRCASSGRRSRLVWFDAGHGSYVNDVVIEHTGQSLEFLYRRLREITAAERSA